MSDVAAALYFFVTVELLGLAVWPLVRAILHRLPDRGWAFAKFGGVLLTTWLLGRSRGYERCLTAGATR